MKEVLRLSITYLDKQVDICNSYILSLEQDIAERLRLIGHKSPREEKLIVRLQQEIVEIEAKIAELSILLVSI